MLPSPLCLMRSLWWSLRSLIMTGYRTEGHVYVSAEVHRGVVVHVDRCEDCGRRQLSWHGGETLCPVCENPSERVTVQIQ